MSKLVQAKKLASGKVAVYVGGKKKCEVASMDAARKKAASLGAEPVRAKRAKRKKKNPQDQATKLKHKRVFRKLMSPSSKASQRATAYMKSYVAKGKKNPAAKAAKETYTVTRVTDGYELGTVTATSAKGAKSAAAKKFGWDRFGYVVTPAKKNPKSAPDMQDAFDAGKRWIISGAADESGVANARVSSYGFSKWWNSLPPSMSKGKAQAKKAFMQGVAAGKRTSKKNPAYSQRHGSGPFRVITRRLRTERGAKSASVFHFNDENDAKGFAKSEKGVYAGKTKTKKNPTTWGTPYYKSRKAAENALAFYGRDTKAIVAEKLRDGEIHIGKPALKAGQRLTLLDNGNRYGITEDDKKKNPKTKKASKPASRRKVPAAFAEAARKAKAMTPAQRAAWAAKMQAARKAAAKRKGK